RPVLILVWIAFVRSGHGHAQRFERVQESHRAFVVGKDFGQTLVTVGGFVGAGAAQFHAHTVHPIEHHLAADFAFFDLDPPPFFPALASRGLGARHDAPGSVDGGIERAAALLAVYALQDHGDVAHGAADEAFLA